MVGIEIHELGELLEVQVTILVDIRLQEVCFGLLSVELGRDCRTSDTEYGHGESDTGKCEWFVHNHARCVL